VMDKIKAAMKPEFPNDPQFNPYAFWGGDNGSLPGADFELKVRQYEGYPNYDKSQFKTPAEFMGGVDKKIEAVWKQQYKLSEFIDPSQFKSGEELKKRYAFVMGQATTTSNTSTQAFNSDENSYAGVGGEEEENAEDFYKKLASQ
jgi:gp32 DNA binding protein like